MNRRSFLGKISVGLGASCLLPAMAFNESSKKRGGPFISNSTLMQTVIWSSAFTQPFTVLQLSDTHIGIENEEDLQYERYSRGMNREYKQVRHYQTGTLTAPAECFIELMELAKQEEVDLIAFTGDIINYPAVASVEFVRSLIESAGIPHIYTAGNHDWHYAGMEGTEEGLRREWCEKRLKPLYPGDMFSSSTVLGGINMVAIDNSIMEIDDGQLDFFIRQLELPYPVALFLHIPLYLPSMEMCCGHPKQWESKNGKSISTKNQLPTREFVKRAFMSENVAGIFAGHWHQYHTITNGKVSQHLSLPGFNGQYRLIRFLPP